MSIGQAKANSNELAGALQAMYPLTAIHRGQHSTRQ
jgi:hypothetical protein